MTSRRTADTSRSGPWLLAPGDAMAASVRWPAEDGPWLVTAHWAKVNGRPVIVGLDVRSFHDEPVDAGSGTLRYPVGDHLAEVTQRVLRGIPISDIRDRTRSRLIGNAEGLLFHAPPEVLADHGAWAAERLATLTAKGEPRKRRPAAGEELLRQVAALYEQAVGLGGKAPAKYVEDRLREAGEPRLSTNGGRVLVRQWIRRARERGYLTVKSPRDGGV